MDALSMSQAVLRVRDAAFLGQSCFISTPNLNFVVAARTDSEFRDSVLHSDLSLADGMPLVWVARLLGIPITERVSGAGLFEALMKHPGEPVAVYFFGGPDGAAEAACRRVNAQEGGLRCVGFDSPGFVTVEAMSTAEHIDRINRSGARFVIVSLGAKKGQRWIELNRHRLEAPVICHLGAVVNFAAGTVSRAPSLVQRLGAEWLWRIAQEPMLWRRYWADGTAFLNMVFREVFPLWLHTRGRKPGESDAAFSICRAVPGRTVLALTGSWCPGPLPAFRRALADALATGDDLAIHLSDLVDLDSAGLGLLMQVAGQRRVDRDVAVYGAKSSLRGLFRRAGALYLLTPASRAEA